MNEIKSCPFCESNHTRLNGDKEWSMFFVSCDECGAEGPGYEKDDVESPAEDAIISWNNAIRRKD